MVMAGNETKIYTGFGHLLPSLPNWYDIRLVELIVT